jgi:hypothetical protein
MGQTDTGLTNNGPGKGITTHYAITYESTLAAADGKDRGNGLMLHCEGDYTWMSGWFGGISLPFTLPVSVQLSAGGYAGAGWGPPITVTPGNGSSLDLVRYLLVSEVVEMMMKSKDNGWGYSFGDGNEGSKGEALSRFLGFDFLSSNGLDTSVVTSGGSTFFVSNSWLSTTERADFVNDNPDDNHPDATTGCTTLFVYYLYSQLKFDITSIINAGAATLAGVYTNLTGDGGDPFPFFKRLLGNAFPGTDTITAGPNLDNPFPLGLLSFWVDKNTFGRDEVQDIIATRGGLVSSAFWLVLEGFSINSFNALNITIPTPTGSFLGLSGISVSPTPATPGGPTPAAPIPEFEDPANLAAPQRIRFSFDLTFTSVAAFPSPGGNPVTGDVAGVALVGGANLPGATADTLFELLGGEDPYFTNIDPSNQSDMFYLSQDLRVFSTAAGTAPLPGAPAFTSDPYASIQSLLGYLNGSSGFTTPGASDPLNALPGQSGYETGDSSVTPVDAAHHQNYNFAIARVRLRGTALASAPNVRVFFRLFVAQSCDTDFQPGTTYKSRLGTSGADLNKPVFPLASGTGLTDPNGQSVQTIPFFATDSAGTHDYDGAVADANIRAIQIPNSQDAVWAYFGCFLDVYDASNNARFGGTHHCIAAEIAYDDAPIPTTTPVGATPSPANWDKLAQRNLQITLSENPKSPATHVIPQAFDLRPSRALLPLPGSLLDLPDELMIDWGRTPPGSTALVYWPQLDSADVLALAATLYSSHLLSAVDAHTLQCTVTKGVSYIPIPTGTGVNFAGLLTIELPSDIRDGQEFNIVVRRITTRRFDEKRVPTPQVRMAKGAAARGKAKAVVAAAAAVGQQGNWRQVSGAFQVRIPVTNKSVMLRPEEDTLAVLKWRLTQMPAVNRWYPVLQRYVDYVAARVDGLGGKAGEIPPSLHGAPRPTKGHHGGDHGGDEDRGRREHEFTGKIIGLAFDRFGDFEGFELRTERGDTRWFHGREGEVEAIVRHAWARRFVISVVVDDPDDEWPSSIVLRSAPRQPTD